MSIKLTNQSIPLISENHAASTIQRAWRNRTVQTVRQVGNWIGKTIETQIGGLPDFAAHAVWANNAHALLQSGVLYSGEELLRRTGKLSSEANVYAIRHESAIPSPTDIPEVVETIKREILPVVSHQNTWQHDYFDKIAKKQGVEKAIELIGCKREEIPYELISNYDRAKNISHILRLHISYEPKQEIFVDEVARSLGQNIDRHLIYQFNLDRDPKACALTEDEYDKYRNPKNQKDSRYDQIWDYIMSTRNRIISQSYVSPTIRMAEGTVRWSYGNVAVARSQTKKFVSPLKRYLSEENRTRQRGYEVFTLSPFENGGKFLSLPLNQEDTIILAPKAIAIEWRKKGNDRIFPIEHLTKRQADFFDVPEELRTNAQLAGPDGALVDSPFHRRLDKIAENIRQGKYTEFDGRIERFVSQYFDVEVLMQHPTNQKQLKKCVNYLVVTAGLEKKQLQRVFEEVFEYASAFHESPFRR